MREAVKRIVDFLGGREFLILLVLSWAGFILIERMGIFGMSIPSYRRIFHAGPSKILSIFLLIHGIIRLFITGCRGRPVKKAGIILFSLSLVTLAAALWVSIFTRFEGEIIRTPGQIFSGFREDYIPQTLYAARYASLPETGIFLGKLNLAPSPDLKKMKKILAEISHSGKWTKGVEGGTLSSALPFFSDWAFLSITDFGYAPKYVLHDLDEKELESHYVHMKLFPPGSEDYFRTLFLGYVFYLRCYPDYADRNGVPETRSAYPENPVCNIRIVRNKDIVYSGLLPPDKKLKFDNYVISLPELKMWIRIRVVRDLGLPVAGAGVLLLITGAAMMSRKDRGQEIPGKR